MVASVTSRALPYRPTRQLRATSEPAFDSKGFRTKEFVDDRGDFYERQRDGDWERWYRIVEKRGDDDELLYRYQPELKPVEHDDIEDRHDDLVFLAGAFYAWLEDAEELRIFGPTGLAGIRKTLKKLVRALDDVRAEIELLRPADLPKF
jgi:hypothetical protein